MANSVIHFDIPADDVERAKQFYGDVFGWQIQAYPGMDYQGVTTAEVADMGFTGYFTDPEGNVMGLWQNA